MVLVKGNTGFTIVEILVTISILALLLMMAVPSFRHLSDSSHLESGAHSIESVLETAKQRTLSSYGDSQWGAYFSTSTNSVTLFRGIDFASRATTSDRIFYLPQKVYLKHINFNGGNEVVFKRIVGHTDHSGSTTLALKGEPDREEAIFLNKLGRVSFSPFSYMAASGLTRDARHIHLVYTREISTTTESLVLGFPGGKTKEIPFAENMPDNNFYWSGEVTVSGSRQKIDIRTHRLNDPDTLFCIHRDARHNSEPVSLDISGDSAATPDLVGYSGDNLTTVSGNSAHINSLVWQ